MLEGLVINFQIKKLFLISGGLKFCDLPPSLLLKRTQEERERIVTEKVAIILISEEENVNLIPFSPKQQALKSKMLSENWDNVSFKLF